MIRVFQLLYIYIKRGDPHFQWWDPIIIKVESQGPPNIQLGVKPCTHRAHRRFMCRWSCKMVLTVPYDDPTVSDISLTVWRRSFSTTSLTHVTSLSLITFALPLRESSSMLFLPCLKRACHLNTVDFFIAGASPAIFNKLNVSVGVCPRLTQNFIAARVSTTSGTTIFALYFSVETSHNN